MPIANNLFVCRPSFLEARHPWLIANGWTSILSAIARTRCGVFYCAPRLCFGTQAFVLEQHEEQLSSYVETSYAYTTSEAKRAATRKAVRRQVGGWRKIYT